MRTNGGSRATSRGYEEFADRVGAHLRVGEQRQELLEATRTHDEIGSYVMLINRDVNSTEEIGAGAASQLRSQTEQLQRTRGMLEEQLGVLDRTKRVLTRMSRRVLSDKCTQIAVILVELILVILLLYIKFL